MPADGDQGPLQAELTAEGVCLLGLNRPGAYNSLSTAMIAALQERLDAAKDDPAVRVIVIRGGGPGFCAGHDLDELRAFRGEAEQRALLTACATLMQTIERSPKPVIAQVHGAAYAAGCQLVAAADLAFAAEDARFATPGVNIGLFCATPMVALSRVLSRKHCLRMLLTGAPIDAREAVRIGLINEAVPRDRLEAVTMAVAREIASKSTLVVSLGKDAYHEQAGLSLSAAYAHCNDVVIENLKAADAREGIAAFLEKRAPQWSDA